jgi:hypothetical protein
LRDLPLFLFILVWNNIIFHLNLHRAVKGNGCTTPQSTQGVCSYITDPECAEVLSIIQQVGLHIQYDVIRIVLSIIQQVSLHIE